MAGYESSGVSNKLNKASSMSVTSCTPSSLQSSRVSSILDTFAGINIYLKKIVVLCVREKKKSGVEFNFSGDYLLFAQLAHTDGQCGRVPDTCEHPVLV